MKYRDARHVGFAWQDFISKTKKFIVNLDLYFPMKSTRASLRFIYFLLYYYCNPQGQIKNRLKNDDVQNLEEQFQAVIQQSTFKFSNARYTDIYRKKETLLIKVVCYCAIVVIAMILFILLVYFRVNYSIKALLISITIAVGMLLSYVIATTGYNVYKSLKQLDFLPGSTFKLSKEGIKATNRSGEVWIPFEEDLIINPYDCMERIFSFFPFTYDGIEFKKLNEKRPKVKIGPVKAHEFFYLMILHYYVNWLKEHKLILNEKYVKEHYFLSNHFKKSIAEKIMIKAIVVPTSHDLSSFSMESEKAVFKYPKDSYRSYIKDEEKLYLIHRQLTVHSMIRNKLILLVICFGLFGLLSALLFIYLQQGPPDEMYLIIFPVVLLFFIAYYFFKTAILLKRIKDVEVIFTESRVIFKRKDWIYPLSYDDITSVERVNAKNKKGRYKLLHFHTKQKAYVMTLYDIGFDNPILKILISKCNAC